MTVLIPTAGIGSRLKSYTNYFNKALLPVGKIPVISHIIDIYPKQTDFIIATGYEGNHIKEYLEYAHPKRKFFYVNILPFKGKDSSLQITLQQAIKYIKNDFVFHVNDAILKEKINLNFKKDTLFISKKYNDLKEFRKVSVKNNHILKIHDKKIILYEKKLYTYIGVAYVKDYKLFKEIINEDNNNLAELNYFKTKCKNNDLNYILTKNWYDAGTPFTLNETLNHLSTFKNLNKLDEAIYFKSNKVFKFNTNSKINKKKILRSKILGNNVPKLIDTSKYFYSYTYVNGRLFSKITPNINEFKKLLHWLEKKLWFKKTKLKPKNFKKNCENFYYFKTKDRINKFYSIYKIKDKSDIINGVKYPKLKKLLNQVDWDHIFKGFPVIFHGDLHFENIIKQKNNFKIIDWRGSFNKDIYFGDIYYDFAKIFHGLIVNHSIIKNEQYEKNIKKKKISHSKKKKSGYSSLQNYFGKYVTKKKFSFYKVKIITALIFLNISPLHSGKYGVFLYYLGKKMLGDLLKTKSDNQI